MLNIELLKREVYKNERRKLVFKTIIFNFIALIIISISLSSVSENMNDPELVKYNFEIKYKYDSLNNILVNELELMKERENRIIRSALNLSDDTTYSNLDKYDLFVIAKNQLKDYHSFERILTGKWDSINSIPMGSPVSIAEMNRISDEYGWRKHPILKRWIFHEGTDIAADTGSDVFSTSDGIVERVIKSDKGYGNRIVINHGYGYKTVYAHLESFNVKKGQVVKKGDLIGSVGSTGLSTGPHLHYEVLLNNRPINPQKYFYYGDKLAGK